MNKVIFCTIFLLLTTKKGFYPTEAKFTEGHKNNGDGVSQPHTPGLSFPVVPLFPQFVTRGIENAGNFEAWYAVNCSPDMEQIS